MEETWFISILRTRVRTYTGCLNFNGNWYRIPCLPGAFPHPPTLTCITRPLYSLQNLQISNPPNQRSQSPVDWVGFRGAGKAPCLEESVYIMPTGRASDVVNFTPLRSNAPIRLQCPTEPIFIIPNLRCACLH
jgi:hypothetical protein